ncbi:MAG: lysylphosphatidylglycerol synthase transmembrane domain-containing protein, partial [Acidimicrobiales bacterium]
MDGLTWGEPGDSGRDGTADAACPPTAGDAAPSGETGAGRRRPRWLPPPKVLLAVLVVAAIAYLVVRLRGDVAAAWRGLSPSDLPWLVPAVAAEAVSFLCYAGVQRRLLSAGGATLPLRTVVGLTAAATGLTNLVPGGAVPSSGWLVLQYRRRGVPLPLALWTVLAGGFSAGVSVLLLLLCGAAIAGLVGPWELAVLLVTLGMGAVVGVAATHRLPALREWLAGGRMPGAELARRAVAKIGDVGQFRASVTGGFVAYSLSVANWVLDVAVLACAFAVLNLPVPWRALVFAYAAAQVAGAVSPLPAGIGFVEGGMIGAFALANIPAGAAVLATVVYRLVTTLGMGAMGGASLLIVQRGPTRRAELSGDAAALAKSGSGG